MWNMSTQTEKVIEVTSVDTAGNKTITTTADHDLKEGDIITYVDSGSASQQIIGLESDEATKLNLEPLILLF